MVRIDAGVLCLCAKSGIRSQITDGIVISVIFSLDKAPTEPQRTLHNCFYRLGSCSPCATSSRFLHWEGNLECTLSCFYRPQRHPRGHFCCIFKKHGDTRGRLPPTLPLTLPVVAQFFNSHKKWLYIPWRQHFSVCLSRSGILPSLRL